MDIQAIKETSCLVMRNHIYARFYPKIMFNFIKLYKAISLFQEEYNTLLKTSCLISILSNQIYNLYLYIIIKCGIIYYNTNTFYLILLIVTCN